MWLLSNIHWAIATDNSAKDFIFMLIWLHNMYPKNFRNMKRIVIKLSILKSLQSKFWEIQGNVISSKPQMLKLCWATAYCPQAYFHFFGYLTFLFCNKIQLFSKLTTFCDIATNYNLWVLFLNFLSTKNLCRDIARIASITFVSERKKNFIKKLFLNCAPANFE